MAHCDRCARSCQKPTHQQGQNVCRSCFWVEDIRSLLCLVPDDHPVWSSATPALQQATRTIHEVLQNHQAQFTDTQQEDKRLRDMVVPSTQPPWPRVPPVARTGPGIPTISLAQASPEAKARHLWGGRSPPPAPTPAPPWSHWCNFCKAPVKHGCVHSRHYPPKRPQYEPTQEESLSAKRVKKETCAEQ